MEFIDLKTQYTRISGEINAAINQVISSGHYIMGKQVAELELALAQFLQVKHSIGVCDGTKALLIALMALGVKPGDEVIVPDFTFISPASMAALLGATVVLVDIDPNTYNISVAELEKAISSKTKAIIAVSLYGQCADFTKINEIATRYNIPVIEDAAQAFGAEQNGKKSCNLSTISTTSFFPSKPLGCYGDGGAIFTNDDELAQKMKWIRVHGQDKRYHHTVLGINGRLDTLQAAILLEKMKIFEQEVLLRQKVANYYNMTINYNNQQVSGDLNLTLPQVAEGNLHVYGQYSLLAKNTAHRNRLIEKLKLLGIPTAIHYPIPLHKQPVFGRGSDYPVRVIGNCAVSQDIADRVFSIPMHPYLTQEQQDIVVNSLY
jgi:UDP-2-acetamido-2-deoxy-ribo-hexuluronate aminotransferase